MWSAGSPANRNVSTDLGEEGGELPRGLVNLDQRGAPAPQVLLVRVEAEEGVSRSPPPARTAWARTLAREAAGSGHAAGVSSLHPCKIRHLTPGLPLSLRGESAVLKGGLMGGASTGNAHSPAGLG